MPRLSAPELRRLKVEKKDEWKRLATEFGDNPNEEQSTQLDGLFEQFMEGGSIDKQIEQAEKFDRGWAQVQAIEARGKESAGRKTDPLPHEDPTNTRGQKHQYSMLKAIREAAGWGEKDGVRGQFGLTGLEAETDAELRKRWSNPNRSPRGILVPNSLPYHSFSAGGRQQLSFDQIDAIRRGAESFAFNPNDPTVESTVSGAGSIPTILGGLIQILRAATVLGRMGVTMMDNMQGLFTLPRQNATTTAYWVTEGQDVTQSAPNVDQVLFTPHTVGVRTPYTRRFLEQTSLDAEQFIRSDQDAVMAREIERAALNGTGSGGQPLGLGQNPLVPLIAAGTNGASLSLANIVAMESALAAANVPTDDPSTGYILDTTVRGNLKTTAKIGSTYPVFLWDGGPTPLNEYKVGVTNLLPTNLTHGSGSNLHAAFFGVWSQMIIATWSGRDVIVNPYSADASGSVIITTLQDLDVEVRHPEAFVKIMDISTF